MMIDRKAKRARRVEDRRAFLINFTFFALILALGYIGLKFLFWPLFPFMLAFAFAVLFQRPVRFIEKKVKIGRGVPALVLVLLVLIVIVGFIALAGALLVSQARELIRSLDERFNSFPQMLESIKVSLTSSLAFLPDSIEGTVVANINDFFDGWISGTTPIDWSFLAGPMEGAFNAAKQVPAAVLSAVVSCVCCVFITIDFPRIRRFVYRQIPPDKREVFSKTKRSVLTSFGKVAKAYLLILCITFLELMIGFKILSACGLMTNKYIIVLSLVIAVVDIIPVLGTGTILIPWALYSLLTGNLWLGIGLAIVYALITVIRQYIEPKLVSLQLGLPPFLTLIAMFFGLQLFGFIGLFLMPMLVMLVKMLSDNGTIHLWRTERDEVEYAKAHAAVKQQDTGSVTTGE